MYLSHRPIYYLSPGRVGICRQGLAVRLRCRCRRTRLCVGVLHVGRLFIASFQWMDPILLVDAVSGVVLVRGGPVGTEAVNFQNHPTDQPNVPTHTPWCGDQHCKDLLKVCNLHMLCFFLSEY